MKTIWIIGDSFSTNLSEDSWISKVTEGHNLVNLSNNGVSEYRIYKTFLSYEDKFKPNDFIIICHTNPHRIFLPDRIDYPTRRKSSHPYCDLVMGDVERKGLFWKFISYIFVTYFYDENFYITHYNLMVESMDRISKEKGCFVIHISGFDVSEPIVSLHDIFLQHRGNINHLTKDGNILVADRILSYLKDSFPSENFFFTK